MRPIDADPLKKWKQTMTEWNGDTFEVVPVSAIDDAPTIEIPTWIPVETREPDAEEREAICNLYGEAAVDDMPMFCGPMPEDGQEILISTTYGVYFDICSVDCEEGLNTLALENRGDWEDVTAWMPLPNPYEPEDQTGGTNHANK